MLLQRTKQAAQESAAPIPSKNKPKVEDFIQDRDYVGAITLNEFYQKSGEYDDDVKAQLLCTQWIAYASFHLGDYKKACGCYRELLARENNPNYRIALAACFFFMGNFKDAEEEAEKSPDSALKTRLLFHFAHKNGNEEKLMFYHNKLQNSTEDQLSLASIHYLRGHYNESIDVYKGILTEYREYLALNVYVALCYYKLDYFEVALEILSGYLSAHPDSAVAINLKACCHFRLYSGKSGEVELKRLVDRSTTTGSASTGNFAQDLLNHNMVVFRSGENALKILPPLVGIIPEATINLAVYLLRHDEIDEAFALLKDIEPATPQEFALKGVVNAAHGQKYDSREHLKVAQQYFQLVGASPNECDTIPGRQCMASCFFILRQFEDVLIYLNSVKSYFYSDDDFNWNYGIAKANVGEFKGAEEALLLIQNQNYKQDYCYVNWLARCFIMNGKARQAWDLYLKVEATNESFSLLQIIASDCYKTNAFLYAAKAYDVLERLDPNPEFWEGKRGACLGIWRQVLAGEENIENLEEAITLLRNSSENPPEVEQIMEALQTWARENQLTNLIELTYIGE